MYQVGTWYWIRVIRVEFDLGEVDVGIFDCY